MLQNRTNADKIALNPVAQPGTAKGLTTCRRFDLRFIDLVQDPSASEGPIIPGGGLGYAQNVGSLLVSHAGEEAQLDDLGFNRMLAGKFIQNFIHSQYFLIRIRSGEVQFLGVNSLKAATMANRKFAAGTVNEDAAHGLGGGGKKMSAIFESLLIITHQTQPG